MSLIDKLIENLQYDDNLVFKLDSLNSEIETSWAIVQAPLVSFTSDNFDDLYDECRNYTVTWIYSVEKLPHSGHYMMRYAWVK